MIQDNTPLTADDCRDLATQCHQTGAELTVRAAEHFVRANDLIERARQLEGAVEEAPKND